MNEAQQRAFSLAVSGHNLYIGGQAGTGKTWLLQRIHTTLSQIKNVHVTCTTGIACSNFGAACKAQTVHSWSGIDDGRYDITKIQSVVQNNKKETHRRISETDVLIVDECSMLSQRQFELLEKACATKNKNLPFGGIQVILCGDFYQLPPVRNLLYHDEGKFCFESTIFQQAIPHKIILDDVIRQNDPQFIKVVNEISMGKVSLDTEEYVKSLSQDFCSQACDSLKLYATNDLVEKHNRDSILRWPGETFEYSSTDSGKLESLHRLLAPPVLWLKKGCPVILLQNISDKLYNGLQGRVISCDSDGPTVQFQSVNITRKITKETFSVYSPDLKKNVAERVQIPLKLAFAMTVHKAQGMTLDSVEVDCRKMFAPGQLGVAISRVRSPKYVRVINFNTNTCIPHPSIINDFLESPCHTQIDDFTCCRFSSLYQPKTPISFLGPSAHGLILESRADTGCDMEKALNVSNSSEETSVPLDATPPELEFEFEDMDLYNDTVLDMLHADSASAHQCDSETQPAFALPASFNTTDTARQLVVKNPVTPIQKETNEVLDLLGSSESVFCNVTSFCEEEFSILMDIVQTIQIDKNQQAIKPNKLAELYRACHDHQTSDQYKARVLLMFFDLKRTISQQVMSHIAYNLTVSIRKFILSEIENSYKISSTTVSNQRVQRNVTEESYGKIRYVGGYCVAKVRQKYTKQLRSNCYKLKFENQVKYKESCLMLEILDNMSVNESIVSQSQFPQSLIETCRKQNVTRGLTNISDQLFEFFVSTCKMCLNLLVCNNVNIHCENLYQFCSSVIGKNCQLFEEFVKCVCTKSMPEDLNKEQVLIPMLVAEMLDTVGAIEQLYKELTDKFLLVMFNQFRKDFLLCLCVEKKMAHRKQILVRSQKNPKEVKVDMAFILDDDSKEKVISHNLLKSIISKNKGYMECFGKKDLVLLCKAYNCQIKSRDLKNEIVVKLNSVIGSVESIPLAELLNKSKDL